ncbi:hypothetical protein [Streptomyces sp. VNUA24]|uniref:hypothetical protein n=1 Tax=Streptomyces sp. VNUA24 TaxID=3031131 RepID=UPI0023B8684E|nr:hypothetical protein [Streptomyces sp. VNUA24]WEH16690.1 hypothetical protein PYR72_24430 [Streptomyces sp. VNUA24]
MTLEISELNACIFTAGCLVTYFVHKHTRSSPPLSPPGTQGPGDVPAAITAGTAVILALAFLLGADEKKTDDAPVPAPSSTSVPSGRPSTHDHPGTVDAAR